MRLLKIIHNTSLIANVFILIVFSSLSQANNSVSKQKASLQSGATVGISYEFSGQKLSFFIDQKELLKTIPKLQKTGFIDANLTPTEIGFYQSLLAATVSLGYATSIVKNIYLIDKDIDLIKVDAYLISPDLYGNTGKTFCYSFDFDRNLYQRINWKKFQADNIKLIAPNFRTSNVCQNLIGIDPTNL